MDNAREAGLILDSVNDIVIREPAENPMENFSSFPPEEEQEFAVYEERMQTAVRSANRIGLVVSGILAFVVLLIIFGFWDPDLLKKEHEQFDQQSAAPAATPPSTPAAAPAATPAAGQPAAAPAAGQPAAAAAPAAAPAPAGQPAPAAAGQPAAAPAAGQPAPAAALPAAAPPAAPPHK